ncbi:MAG TPA: helix-turn-helix domain-containing protein [Burkholderiales bacterium]|nr:helix-turn-helix domain-containing protein [Burkholderiales bacterium]
MRTGIADQLVEAPIARRKGAAKTRAEADADVAAGETAAARDVGAGPNLAGTQTAGRAIHLLRIIAAHNPVGITLTDLSAASKLTRPTTYRLATCLIAEGMAIRDPATRRYDLGPRAFQLGLTTYAFSEVLRICSPAVNRVAAATQDHVCLVIRTGFDTVPICEIPAAVPVRPLIRRYAEPVPIGATPGGVALLAHFSPAQVRQILKHNEKDPLRRHRTDPQAILPAVQAAKRNGYAVRVNYHFHGVGGVAVTIPTGSGAPFLALSNLSVNERIVGSRQKFLIDLLSREATQLGVALAENRLAF